MAPKPTTSTPKSSKKLTADINSPASSPSRSTAAGPAPSTPTRGPLPLAQETSYHRRLRALLLTHKQHRKEWNELVLRGLVGRLRGVIELRVECETGLTRAKKGDGKVGMGYLLKMSERISEQLELVNEILLSLDALLGQLNSVVEKAEYLVVEAARIKGNLWTFREPLWGVSWSLGRFADGLASITTPYTSSLQLIHDLVDTLTTFSPLPTINSSASSTKPPASSTSEFNPPSKSGQSATPTAEELQAAMSLLAVQPLLPSKQSEWGSDGWEELLRAEVGGWT